VRKHLRKYEVSHWRRSYPRGFSEPPIWVAYVNGHKLTIWVEGWHFHWSVNSDKAGLFITAGGRTRSSKKSEQLAEEWANKFAPGEFVETLLPSEKGTVGT
jgi:hypothetical protein